MGDEMKKNGRGLKESLSLGTGKPEVPMAGKGT